MADKIKKIGSRSNYLKFSKWRILLHLETKKRIFEFELYL